MEFNDKFDFYKQLFSRLKNRLFFIFSLIFSFCALFFISVLFLISAPADFPTRKVITIEEGKTLKEVAVDFEKQKLIRSPFVFETIGWLMKTEKQIKAGEYFFEEKMPAGNLMKAVSGNDYLKFTRITIPEGFTLRDIFAIFEDKKIWSDNELWQETGIPGVECINHGCLKPDSEFLSSFALLSSKPGYASLEGFLFPDTYYVPLSITPKAMVKIMLENTEKKITPDLREKIGKSGHSFYEILTMASLLEKEAAKKSDREIISGILWKRLEAGMPLQVDATILYILGDGAQQPSLADLKIDSPYNTYVYKGLPSGPICNPGLDSIEAALSPKDSPYWYYLSSRNYVVHYSTTFDEHVEKKGIYLW